MLNENIIFYLLLIFLLISAVINFMKMQDIFLI